MPIVADPRQLDVPPPAATIHPVPKIIHLQILRALAASLVVADHTFGSLASRGSVYSQTQQNVGFTGTTGVSAFFILSGLIMMRQSSSQFGEPGAPFAFMLRRILRIVPMYWLATLLWFASLVSWKIATPHAKAQLLYSLAFIPNYLSGVARSKPILQQGWTLNFEMFFYLLFAAALLLPRRSGVRFLLTILAILALIGLVHRFPLSSAWSALLRFYTDPILWLFACGIFIGFLEVRKQKLPRITLPFSPAFLLLIPPMLFAAFPILLHRSQAVAWFVLQFYCAAVVALCTLVTTGPPGRITRLMVLLGDASYSTYLFHLWVYVWIIPPIARLSSLLHLAGTSAILFIAAALVAANLLGLIIHLTIERPLTRFLRKYT